MPQDEKPLTQGAAAIGTEQNEMIDRNSREFLDMLAQKGMPIKELLGFSDEVVEGMYAQAYNLYNSGKYEEALSLFRILILLVPQESKYIIGLAACFHQMKSFRKAAEVYMMASFLDQNNPIPPFHASDCYLQMNDTLSAIVALETAIEVAAERPEYQMLKDRAKITLDGLKSHLKKEQ